MGKKVISKLGDKRLEKVYTLLVGAMISRYTVILRQLSKTRGEEVRFGRFVNNAKINPQGLIDFYWSESRKNFAGKHLLVISDSSTISFNAHSNRIGLGHVGSNTTKEGFTVHPSILVDAETYANYGVGGLTFSKRTFARTVAEKEAKKNQSRNRGKIAFEEKETYKWFASPKQSIENCPNAASYTLIGDRDSDIYDLISLTLDHQWQFVFRSKTNRRLSENRLLHPVIDKWEIQHQYSLALRQTKDRSAHQAELSVKYGKVAIKKPNHHYSKDLPETLDTFVVEVKEKAVSVVGEEQPVHWILLTSHPITNTEQALQVIKWYCWRWNIEEVFRTLKLKGLDVEHSQIETYQALQNITTLALIAANQVMQLVNAREKNTSQKKEDVFLPKECSCIEALNNKLQGQTQKQKNPHPIDSLAFAVWVIARLGGWKGYQSERPPGPITLFKGLTKFYQILEGYYLLL